MTAKEMFEELEYEQTYCRDGLIEYRDDNNMETIQFFNATHCVRIDVDLIQNVEELTLSDKEKRAIHQQMKELGWIE